MPAAKSTNDASVSVSTNANAKNSDKGSLSHDSNDSYDTDRSRIYSLYDPGPDPNQILMRHLGRHVS